MKLLTVTVPCYNSAEYMEKCIESLLVGGERVEIIIVNDGSTDSTKAIADSYAERYPSSVKVIHQENGGHGEGVNQGVLHATGKYFKVVDSDDVLSEDFPLFLDKLEECEAAGGTDLFVTNYYYVHSDGVGDRSISYKSVFPENKIFSWSESRRFRLHQLLTIHSSTFRTEIMRGFSEPLDKHIFYEDNLMVYRTLPKVKKIYYADMDLYRYWIGRPDQSVQENVMKARYMHQIRVTEKCFTSCHLDDIKEKMLKKYLRHELFILFAIAILNARLNKTDESDAAIFKMWERSIAFDKKWGKHFRYRTVLALISIPGAAGRNIAALIYRLANKIVRFN